MTRRGVPWPALVAGVAVLAGACTGDRDGPAAGERPGQPAAAPAPVVEPSGVPPAESYRVVYRIEDTAGPDAVVSTDVIQVHQPFHVRLEHREGPPPGGAVLSATVVNAEYTFRLSQGAERFATGRIPGPLPLTMSVEALEAAAEAGVVERLGPDHVGSESCTGYAYRRAGEEPLSRPDAADRVESCVSPDGILLRRHQSLGGRQVRVTEAVEIERDPPRSPETFLTDRSPERLLETEQLVTVGEPPEGAPLVPVVPPAGFTADRQVRVDRQLGPQSPPVALYVRGFRRDAELVAVEELLTPTPESPWPMQEGVEVDLGGGRTGRMVYRAGSCEVRFIHAARAVRVSSSRPPLALAVARTIAG